MVQQNILLKNQQRYRSVDDIDRRMKDLSQKFHAPVDLAKEKKNIDAIIKPDGQNSVIALNGNTKLSIFQDPEQHARSVRNNEEIKKLRIQIAKTPTSCIVNTFEVSKVKLKKRTLIKPPKPEYEIESAKKKK